MKYCTVLLSVLFAVIITIKQPPMPTVCPSPEPFFVRQPDGAYIKSVPQLTTLQMCFSNEETWQEEWTDYPEKGGKFIRKIQTKEVK